MRSQFKAIAVFVVLCLTPTSYARYYDPEYGRFLSRDEMEGSLDSAPSLHRFAYAKVNPVRYTDPSGNCPNCVGAGIGAVVGFGLGFGAALLDGRSVGDAAKTGAVVGLAGAMIGGSLGAAAGPGFAMAANAMAVRGAIGFTVSATREFTAAKAEGRDPRLSDVVVGTALFAAPVPRALAIPLGIGAGAVGSVGAVKTIVEGRNSNNNAMVLLGAEDMLLSGLSFGAGARGAAGWAAGGRGGGPPPTLVPAEGMIPNSSGGAATTQGGFNPFPLFSPMAAKARAGGRDSDLDPVPDQSPSTPEQEKAYADAEAQSRGLDPSAPRVVRGTNRETTGGAVTDRSKFRDSTLWEAWDQAPEGPTGGVLCSGPGCSKELKVPPGGARDWHGGHDPAWTKREFPADVDRQTVIDEYQTGVTPQCPECNLKLGNQ